MQGKIICIKADLFRILSDNITYEAKASKLILKNKQELKVGDLVEFEILEENKAYINKLYERRNDLVRPTIANIDLAVVATSVKEPIFNDNLLDRFLTILNFNNVEAVIAFTKWDLLEGEEIQKMEQIKAYYESIGYKCYKTSTIKTLEEASLLNLFRGKICVLTGQSGVGKSSLLNKFIPGLNLETNEISTALGRGKHTTRHVELIPCAGGYVADTPGFGTMELIDMEEVDIAQSFVEFFKASPDCKYNGCLHNNEPNCKVKELVENGQILRSRYTNYLQFLNEVKVQRKW